MPRADMADMATMAHRLAYHAAVRPGRRAFIFLERGTFEADTMTFAELDRRARIIAGELHARGLRGRTVVLAYPSGLDVIAALFGCFYAGAIAVVASNERHGRARQRLHAILADCRADCILSLRGDPSVPEEQWAETTGSAFLVIHTDMVLSQAQAVAAMLEPAEGTCLLQYTSGSTGNPRAVMLTHANLMHNQGIIAHLLGSTPEIVGVSWLPLYHDMGLIGAVLQAVYAGGCCVLMSPLAFLQRPVRWLQAISAYKAAVSMAPAFAYALCSDQVREDDVGGLELSAWRAAICGGETIRPRALERFAGRFRAAGFDPVAFRPAYGLAEATLLATATKPGTSVLTHAADTPCGTQGAGRLRVCCGGAWNEQEVAIVDPQTCLRCEEGFVGEIWLRGGSVAAGYWRREAETCETFGARIAGEAAYASWLRTGDLGYLCAGGLVVTGRLKDMIVIRGANIDPGDIEAAASSSDARLEQSAGAAFTIEGAEADALVLLQEISRACLEEIDTQGLVGTLAAMMSREFGLVLHDLVLLRPGTLPRTSSGKVRRHACRDAYLAGTLRAFPAIDHPLLGRCRRRSHEAVLQ